MAEGEAAERPIREILAVALRELLPLDGLRTREHRVTLHLRAQAQHDPDLAELVGAADGDVLRRVATAVSNGTVCGEVAEDVDVDVAATRIVAAAHGLATLLAVSDGSGRSGGSAAGDRADAVLAPVLATVFTGDCRRHGTPRPGPRATRP